MRPLALLGLFVGLTLLGDVPAASTITLPTLWRLQPPTGPVAGVGLFPQGVALSPDGTRLAVVCAGLGPAALYVLDAATLHSLRTVPLAAAFGRPIWTNDSHVLVAAENQDAVYDVDTTSGTAATWARVPKGSWAAQVAVSPNRRLFAVSDLMTGNVTVGNASNGSGIRTGRIVHVGGAPEGPLESYRSPSDLIFSPDSKLLYVAMRGGNQIAAIYVASNAVSWIAVGRHPDALAFSKDGSRLYVADADDDALSIVDVRTRRAVTTVALGLSGGPTSGFGASPNALAVGPNDVYVSLGAENAVAVVRGRTVIGRIPSGWYPTGIALGSNGNRLYVADAKGETSPANPQYNPFLRGHDEGYVGSSLDGSIRIANAHDFDTGAVIADAAAQWTAPLHTVVRPDGPIKHVIYIIKENRTYDQVLGDIPQADGDPGLVWFGQSVTPNEHAIAERFGIFDRTFADAQVSADGHNWSTAAFANDYVERFWPQNYADRDSVYDFEDGAVASVPHNGYLWDDAARAGITYRDYGEFVRPTKTASEIVVSDMPHLADGHVAPHAPGWNLDISDQVRYEAWKAEFDDYVTRQDLPQLEIVRLPNDHTMGTRPGALTPQAYAAQNDYAFGEIVDAVSHSPYWATTAIFAIEDDAQDGPDHVDDQRTTFYLASPYARGGVQYAAYTTSSVLHTIEILLGLQPMSIYDAVAPPLYDAFGLRPDLTPYDAIAPRVDVNERNTRTAYGAEASERLNFTDADEADPRVLNDILAHAAAAARKRPER
jgi:YVTN family beta-propeller protein